MKTFCLFLFSLLQFIAADRNKTYANKIAKQNIIDDICTHGTWRKATQNITIEPNLLGSERCFQDLTKTCKNATRNSGLSYFWYVNNHVYRHYQTHFTLRQICHVMNGRTIMMVGDSITSEFATTFLNFLYAMDPWQCSVDLSLFTTGMHEISCRDFGLHNFRIQIVRNDLLSLVKKRVTRKGNNSINDNKEEFAWTPLVSIVNPFLYILNRGAHYYNTSILVHDVKVAIDFILKNNPQAIILWRNTPRGVENHRTTFFKAPYKNPLDPSRPSKYKYSYEQFYKQNLAIRDLIEKYTTKNVFYWDISFPMSYREDGHRDPLHYCIPGPMDSWSHLFWNIISVILK